MNKRKDYTKEEVKNLSRNDLELLAIQLTAHNIQLRALLKKTLEEGKGSKKKKYKERPFSFEKYNSRHIFLKFAYLGWDYSGYAVQEDTLSTIEHVVFESLLKTKLLRDRQTANYHRCGRTDKGVSAFSQVISLTVRSKALRGEQIKEEEEEINYVETLNRVLPPEIRMLAWSPVNPEMSARFDCVSRTYKYFFPLGSLALKPMQEAASYLMGTHDFRNLCKMDVGNGVVNFVRTVDRVTLDPLVYGGKEGSETLDPLVYGGEEGSETLDPLVYGGEEGKETDSYTMCVATLQCKGFLWHQIRAIMAVLLLVGEGKEQPEVVRQLMDVERHPCKPQYPLASELPLCLFEADYEPHKVQWRVCPETLTRVVTSLQSMWAQHAIKGSMIRSMLYHISCNSSDSTVTQHLCLRGAPSAKVHTPLLSRDTCESLDKKVQHYVKRRRLDADFLDSVNYVPTEEDSDKEMNEAERINAVPIEEKRESSENSECHIENNKDN